MPIINAKKMRILNNKETLFTNRDKILLSNKILEKQEQISNLLDQHRHIDTKSEMFFNSKTLNLNQENKTELSQIKNEDNSQVKNLILEELIIDGSNYNQSPVEMLSSVYNKNRKFINQFGDKASYKSSSV